MVLLTHRTHPLRHTLRRVMSLGSYSPVIPTTEFGTAAHTGNTFLPMAPRDIRKKTVDPVRADGELTTLANTARSGHLQHAGHVIPCWWMAKTSTGNPAINTSTREESPGIFSPRKLSFRDATCCTCTQKQTPQAMLGVTIQAMKLSCTQRVDIQQTSQSAS